MLRAKLKSRMCVMARYKTYQRKVAEVAEPAHSVGEGAINHIILRTVKTGNGAPPETPQDH